MFVEYCLSGRGIVLRADRENDTALAELFCVALEGEMRLTRRITFSKDYPFEAVVADDASPQGVIEVEYETFLGESASGSNDSGQQLAVHRRHLRRDLDLCLKPARDVEPGVDAISLGDSREV